MPYGYLGVKPNQKVRNAGILDVTDHAILAKDGYVSDSLELIQSQTISSGTTLDFTSIKETGYDVHFIIGRHIETATATNPVDIRLSNDGGSSFEAGTSYELAFQYHSPWGTGEVKSTGTDAWDFTSDSQNQDKSSYAYLYNLGNSAKYSYYTFMSAEDGYGLYGGGVYDTAETINAIRFRAGSAWTGIIDLYGVKQV
tara:strand:- start:1103 stop:1696 length:594 start_codon:yes stop_codon:yes gene_type:complete